MSLYHEKRNMAMVVSLNSVAAFSVKSNECGTVAHHKDQ